MLLCTAVRQRIINIAAKEGVSLHKLALSSGIPYSTLSSFMNGKSTSLTLTTLLHLCEGAHMDLVDFFKDPLFNDVEAEDVQKNIVEQN